MGYRRSCWCRRIVGDCGACRRRVRIRAWRTRRRCGELRRPCEEPFRLRHRCRRRRGCRTPTRGGGGGFWFGRRRGWEGGGGKGGWEGGPWRATRKEGNPSRIQINLIWLIDEFEGVWFVKILLWSGVHLDLSSPIKTRARLFLRVSRDSFWRQLTENSASWSFCTLHGYLLTPPNHLLFLWLFMFFFFSISLFFS